MDNEENGMQGPTEMQRVWERISQLRADLDREVGALKISVNDLRTDVIARAPRDDMEAMQKELLEEIHRQVDGVDITAWQARADDKLEQLWERVRRIECGASSVPSLAEYTRLTSAVEQLKILCAGLQQTVNAILRGPQVPQPVPQPAYPFVPQPLPQQDGIWLCDNCEAAVPHEDGCCTRCGSPNPSIRPIHDEVPVPDFPPRGAGLREPVATREGEASPSARTWLKAVTKLGMRVLAGAADPEAVRTDVDTLCKRWLGL